MTIELDYGLAKKLASGMRQGDAVELPFPVVYLWTINGQPIHKQQGGALYFGGWACKAEELQTIADQQGLPIPSGWKQVTIASRDGDEYEAYTTRHVIVAPIGRRESWILPDGRRSGHYVEGGRRHLQVLCYMGEKQGDAYQPWGPVVLTAKGYQARNVLDAFTTWDKVTAAVRRQVAPTVPPWCFYLALGTFDKERRAISVGKPGAQSTITPVGAYVPPEIGEKHLKTLFVGQEVASIMGDLQDQAADWLAAWKAPQKSQDTGDDAPDNFDPAWNMEYPAEDVPF